MVIPANFDVREKIAIAHNNADFRTAVLEIRDRYLPYHEGEKVYAPECIPTKDDDESMDCNLTIPPWICHSYVRAPPQEHIDKLARHEALAADPNVEKRQFFDDEGNQISRKKMKKLRRVNRRQVKKENKRQDRPTELCSKCLNPRGNKCDYRFCRACCKDYCSGQNQDCAGHKLMIKTIRERMAGKVTEETVGME